MNRYLDLTDEVKNALEAGKPVVALESTIISHGMPYPKNVETAVSVENVIRENGAVPATIAIIGGRLKVGLTPEQLEYFGKKGTALPGKVALKFNPNLLEELSKKCDKIVFITGTNGKTTSNNLSTHVLKGGFNDVLSKYKRRKDLNISSEKVIPPPTITPT